MTEVRNQENAILLAASTKMVALGAEAGEDVFNGIQPDKVIFQARKIFKLLKAYRKKAELDDLQIDAILYALKELSQESEFPTVNPLVGQSLNVQFYVNGGALQWFDEGVDVGPGIEEVNFIGSGVAAVKVGNRLNVTVSGGSGGGLLITDGLVDVADVTLDFEITEQVLFTADAVIGSAKTWAFDNTTGAKKFDFIFTMSSLDAQTMPASVLMGDVRWNGTAWTPTDLGKYRASGVYDGTNWLMEISQSIYF